ncbi:transglutaminase TgpA family protein [Streptomyces tauricus]|uniref:transglutaminase TgpA family protein n=1 Tax=Streptomyces tauricus TaxID=68274 RepID=UPI0033A833D2
MSGRARLALCAAAATLMASCALLPLVDPATWFLQAAFLLAVQTGVGAAARRVPLARPLTIAVQALVTLMLLTLSFAREQAVAGLLPGPDVFRYFGELLQAGADDVSRYSIPAPLSDGIRLMMVGGVVVIGLAVDALAVTFRSAAPAGLPLLALYSVAAGLADGGAGWIWFLLAATGYLVLLLAEGRDRLSQWGRVFGGGPRAPGGDPSGSPTAPVRTGRRIGAVALGVALVVPLALPALDGGLLDAARTGVAGGSGGGNTISAVNPLVSLSDSLNVDEDREVMSYRTNSEETQNLYLRIVSLDEFDGTAWKPAKRHVEDVPGSFPTPPGLSDDVRRTEVQTRISAADWYAQDWLPLPYPASQVGINGKWRFEPVGRTLVGDHGQTTRGQEYTVKSLIVQPTADQLANAPEAPEVLKREFTKVPNSLPPVVAATARQITADSANDYERAVKLQDWFALEGGFTYDTEVKVGSGSQAIARFLRDKEGFCVHFSFAMASMARTLGIPARVAVGFTPGSPKSDGTMSVGLRDAHAWPELYFEGVGWTRFEPTPNRGSVPDYTRTDTPGAAVPDPDAPSRSSSSEPSAAPSGSEDCTAAEKKLEQPCASESPQAAFGATNDDPPWWLSLLLWLAGGLAVGTLPLLPMLWRLRARSVRLGSHHWTVANAGGVAAAAGQEAGGDTGMDLRLDGQGRATEARTAAVALEAWQEVSDTAWDFGIPPDESQTPRKAAARIVRVGHLEPEAAASVHRIADAVEQVLYAPSPRPAPGLSADVRRMTQGLRATASRGTRLRALLAPRSAVRVVWAASDRWHALKYRTAVRWTALLRRPSSQGGSGG